MLPCGSIGVNPAGPLRRRSGRMNRSDVMELILSLLRKGEPVVSIQGCRGECRWDAVNSRWFCHLYDGEQNYEGYGRSRSAAIRKASEAYVKAMGWAVP